MARVCVIARVSEVSAMLPGTVVAAILIAPAFRNAKLPLAPGQANVAPGKLFGWVDRWILPAEVKPLVNALNTPLSVMPPVTEVADSVPPTLDAAKFKLVEFTAALPALLRATAPVRLLVCVDKSIVLADVKLLALASVSTPLSVIAPVVELAVRAAPTFDAPRFKLAELIDAAPVPVVFNETAPAKLLACVARLMLWLAVWVVKLPPPAVIAPLSVIPPVVAVPVSVPPTLDAPKFNAAASMVAVPVPAVLRATPPVKLFAPVATSILWLAPPPVTLPPPALTP